MNDVYFRLNIACKSQESREKLRKLIAFKKPSGETTEEFLLRILKEVK